MSRKLEFASWMAALTRARRLLGAISLDTGNLAAAEADLGASHEIFADIPVPYERARTCVTLAEVAGRRGDRRGAVTHLR